MYIHIYIYINVNTYICTCLSPKLYCAKMKYLFFLRYKGTPSFNRVLLRHFPFVIKGHLRFWRFYLYFIRVHIPYIDDIDLLAAAHTYKYTCIYIYIYVHIYVYIYMYITYIHTFLTSVVTS